jgi:uncharacterized Tic20 family protein
MQPTNDERTLAALAHASIVLNTTGLIGLVAVALIWATQRERSAYVRGHAIQALGYQVLVLVIAVILTLSWAMCLSLSLLPAALRPELYAGGLPGLFWVAIAGMALPALFGIAAAVYALFGAAQAYRLRPFFYPLVGRFATNDLAPVPLPAPEVVAPVPEAQPVAVVVTSAEKEE